MTPALASGYVAHGRWVKPEVGRDLPLSLSSSQPGQYFSNVGLADLRPPVLFAPSYSALPLGIPHVVRLGTHEQVRGVHTCTVVAMVTDVEARRNVTTYGFPHDPVSHEKGGATKPDHPIVVMVKGPGPQPAPRVRFGSRVGLKKVVDVWNRWHAQSYRPRLTSGRPLWHS